MTRFGVKRLSKEIFSVKRPYMTLFSVNHHCMTLSSAKHPYMTLFSVKRICIKVHYDRPTSSDLTGARAWHVVAQFPGGKGGSTAAFVLCVELLAGHAQPLKL